MSGEPPRADRLTPRNVALSDEAIDWVVRLGSGTATDEDRAAFARWRDRSPAHADAAEEAASILGDIEHTRVATDYREVSTALRGTFSSTGRPRISRRAILAGAAAAGVVGVGASGVFGPPAGLLADHATGVGGRKRIALDDGSVVWLNTASALSVDYSDTERRIALYAGEALFEVAKDKARPFIVSSGDGEARAVGTIYSVRRRGSLSDVVVTEGIVEVRSGLERIRLTAGQQIAYGGGIVGGVHPSQGDAAIAWSRGKLIFNRRPLAEVATELERYQFGKVMVRGERLKRLEVTGVFELADPEAMLRAISSTIGVSVTQYPLLTIIG